MGPWTWEEGQGATSNLTYINWDETMPCSDADIINNTGDCGECVNMDATGEWFSHNCDDLHSFVCEYTWDLGEEGTTTVATVVVPSSPRSQVYSQTKEWRSSQLCENHSPVASMFTHSPQSPVLLMISASEHGMVSSQLM